MEKILKISIIVPVVKEDAVINDLIDGIANLPCSEKTEIIVVDGDPEGSTIDSIKNRDVLKVRSPRGRGRQMNEGAKVAQGEMLLFLHADTALPGSALEVIEYLAENKKIVAGAFDLGIQSDRFVFRVIERIASFRSRLTRIPFGDQAIFIRRAFFDETGGYDDIPLMEDVAMMRRIKKRGGKVVIIGEKVLTSSRRWEKEGILYCTLRNWLIQTLYCLGVPPGRLAKYYNQGR